MMMRYQVFMIDPPWPKRKGGLRAVRPNQTRLLDYPTMTVADIFALLDQDIFPLATANHCVFLWCIDQFLAAGEQAMLSRGYKLHARLVWDKTNGVAPAFTVRYTHEYLLWFYRRRLPAIAPSQRGRFTTILRAKAREHSRKPDEAYQMISLLYPDVSRLDVFSREARVGWDQWGNDCAHFTNTVQQMPEADLWTS